MKTSTKGTRASAPAKGEVSEPIDTVDLTPARWADFERLFGENGACGGCWCMWWRIEKGEKWPQVKGPAAKRRMKKLVTSGQAQGVLAYAGEEPVGWCSYGPRKDYPRLDRARTLACDDAERVWSIPCFFVKSGWRGRGVATALLKHAVGALAKHGAPLAEGYPVKPSRAGSAIPAAFAWTGTRALFEACGFEAVGAADRAKQRFRRTP